MNQGSLVARVGTLMCQLENWGLGVNRIYMEGVVRFVLDMKYLEPWD